MYAILYNLHYKNVHSSPWNKCVNNMFQSNDIDYIWLTQDYKINAKIVYKCYQFKQLWHIRMINDINDCDAMHKLFKYSHEKEKYTETLPEHLKKALFQFRIGT